jgi:hypothetical protein
VSTGKREREREKRNESKRIKKGMPYTTKHRTTYLAEYHSSLLHTRDKAQPKSAVCAEGEEAVVDEEVHCNTQECGLYSDPRTLFRRERGGVGG